jgi:hypothetical protein
VPVRDFHLGDVLSITTGCLLSPRGLGGVYSILGWMQGEDRLAGMVTQVARECQGPLLAQYPQLAAVRVPDDLEGEGPVREWLAAQVAVYGEMLPVEVLPEDGAP